MPFSSGPSVIGLVVWAAVVMAGFSVLRSWESVWQTAVVGAIAVATFLCASAASPADNASPSPTRSRVLIVISYILLTCVAVIAGVLAGALAVMAAGRGRNDEGVWLLFFLIFSPLLAAGALPVRRLKRSTAARVPLALVFLVTAVSVYFSKN